VRALVDKLGHYATRFLCFFRLEPLLPREQQVVHGQLLPAEAALFWDLQPEDQRHSFAVASRVMQTIPGDDEAVRAALLHDVGKRHSELGAFRRSLATVLGHLGLPLGDRMRSYWDHGAIGAADLAAAGSSEFVVAFAAHHSDGEHRAGSERWQAVLRADV